MFPAFLITIDPVAANETNENYAVIPEPSDLLITRSLLESAVLPVMTDYSDTGIALVMRTLPNDDSKLTRQYGIATSVPPYFTTEAMEYVVASGVKHLLVDMPSIDRIFDEGKLSNHRIFWNVEQGKFNVNDKTRRQSTVTELIYVPNSVPDGGYLLNLQIAPFAADASPSRPILLSILD
jgi:kynurenine formamidase